MTTGQTDLRRASRLYAKRRQAQREAYAVLVPLILDARRSGATLRQIAEVTGLSYGRIFQVEQEAKRGGQLDVLEGRDAG